MTNNRHNTKEMNAIIRKVRRFFANPIFVNPTLLLSLWVVVTLAAALLKCAVGPDEYNNYMIFQYSAHHLFDQLPLYVSYPAEYYDLYLYGPLFTVIIAPFAMLPPAVGMIVWVIALSGLLYWSIRRLPVVFQAQSIIMWISLNELFTALTMQQFNVAVVALVIGSFVMIERDKPGWAVFMILIGTMVKLYGIVGLAFFFFVKRKGRFVAMFLVWAVILLVLPMLFSSADYVLGQYGQWYETLIHKNQINAFAGLQNLSLLGMVRKISGDPLYSDLWIIVPGMAMFAASYLRIGQYKNLNFRLMILASVLIFMVIFSSGSENSSHVIAALGVGVWCVASPVRWGWLQWVLLLSFIFMTFSRSIIGYDLDVKYIVGYSLKVLPFTLIWLRICYELYTKNFAGESWLGARYRSAARATGATSRVENSSRKYL